MNRVDPGADLLRAILESPRDDLRRLVYADWLEEQGEDLQAELIRLQCRINSLPFGDERWHAEDLLGRELKIIDSMPDFLCLPGQLLDNYAWTGTGITTIEYDSGAEAWWRRGFAYRVEMRLEAFMEHAKALFEHHPITEVVLTDKRPWTHNDFGGKGRWWFQPRRFRSGHMSMWDLPLALWQPLCMAAGRNSQRFGKCRLLDFDSCDEALATLARAAVLYGRGRVGLPTLEERA